MGCTATSPSSRCLVVAGIDLPRVRQERQNFDATGHYSGPDVFHLTVDRSRRRAAHFED